MVTRTFRINPEYDEVLSEEAEKQGLSVSALLNQIIQRYVLFTRFTERTPAITLPYSVFDFLIERVRDEDLVEVGEKTGAVVPEETLLQRGKIRNFDSVVWLLENVYDKYNNWFNCSRSVVNGEERIHLAHPLSEQWSRYLGGYVNSAFNSILDVNPKMEVRSNSVTVYLPRQAPLTRVFKSQKI